MRASKQALPIYWMLLYPHYIHLSLVVVPAQCPCCCLVLMLLMVVVLMVVVVNKMMIWWWWWCYCCCHWTIFLRPALQQVLLL